MALSSVILRSLRVELPLQYCVASLVKLKNFRGRKATIALITLYTPRSGLSSMCSVSLLISQRIRRIFDSKRRLRAESLLGSCIRPLSLCKLKCVFQHWQQSTQKALSTHRLKSSIAGRLRPLIPALSYNPQFECIYSNTLGYPSLPRALGPYECSGGRHR